MAGRLEYVRKNVEVDLEPIQEHQKLKLITEVKNVKDHPQSLRAVMYMNVQLIVNGATGFTENVQRHVVVVFKLIRERKSPKLFLVEKNVLEMQRKKKNATFKNVRPLSLHVLPKILIALPMFIITADFVKTHQLTNGLLEKNQDTHAENLVAYVKSLQLLL